MHKTTVVKKEDIKREWLLVNLSDQVLGRVAAEIAMLLSGKNKALKSPNADVGDYVVAINASKIAVTGRKSTDKMYYRHSGYLGGLTETNFARQLEKDPTYIIREAVKGMLPKNKLRATRMARFYVYKDEKHDKTAQVPKEFKINR